MRDAFADARAAKGTSRAPTSAVMARALAPLPSLARSALAALGPLGALVAAGLLGACSSSLPAPPTIAPPPAAFEEVPYPPPPARVEFVPDQPRKHLVWVDGYWDWQGGHWRWQAGGWYEVPRDVLYSPWTTQRPGDGRLLYAASAWRDRSGRQVAAPAVVAPGRSSGDKIVDRPAQAYGTSAPPGTEQAGEKEPGAKPNEKPGGKPTETNGPNDTQDRAKNPQEATP